MACCRLAYYSKNVRKEDRLFQLPAGLDRKKRRLAEIKRHSGTPLSLKECPFLPPSAVRKKTLACKGRMRSRFHCFRSFSCASEVSSARNSHRLSSDFANLYLRVFVDSLFAVYRAANVSLICSELPARRFLVISSYKATHKRSVFARLFNERAHSI